VSAQRIGDRKMRRTSERLGVELIWLYRLSNQTWEAGMPQGDGHAHILIDTRTWSWRPVRGGGCFHACTTPRRWLTIGNPGYSPEQRRADFDTTARAIRELSNAWVRSAVPSADVGQALVAEAMVALSRIAVAADVPLEAELETEQTPKRRARAAGLAWGFE
jgi:hypothetical protein